MSRRVETAVGGAKVAVGGLRATNRLSPVKERSCGPSVVADGASETDCCFMNQERTISAPGNLSFPSCYFGFQRQKIRQRRSHAQSFASPAISVVMPTYDTPISDLRRAVESILNQTFRDFEFIIIDDGSTNGSDEYLNRFKTSA